MKTKLLFTIAGIFLMATLQVFSSVPTELNQEMSSETQFADGKVLTVKVLSEGIINNKLGDTENRKVSIYLPPGYDENGKTNYPVIYMLSDFNGTNEDWFKTFGQSNLPGILDKSIKSGKIKPVIMVFPDGKNKVGGGWYTNSAVAGNWEDFVVSDVVNYIDQNFHTLPFAASRGIAGKGMGAFGALKLATLHPDIFSCVYALNALVDLETIVSHEYIWSNSFKKALEATAYPTDDKFANQLLSMAIAFAPDQNKPALMGNLPKTETGEIVNAVFEKWMQQDPLQMIQKNADNLKALKAVTVDCSTSDVGIMLSSNYSEALKQNGVDHKFSYFAGTEKSDLLNRVTDVMLPMLSQNLSHSLLECNVNTCHTYSDVLKTSMITDGTIFISPVEVTTNGVILKSENVIKFDVSAKAVKDIPLSNFEKGIYSIYGVSNSGFNGEPRVFGLNGGTPLVTICVIDSYTGKKIKTCQMTVDGAICEPEKGFNKEGTITVCIKKENYGDLTKNATIYTDTTITISLVKNSYIQVIEKGYSIPIYEAMVTQNNQATLTAKNGFTTIYNMQDEMLDCRVFKSGYFTEVVHSPIKPGATKVIELTKKKATIDFYIAGNEGPTFGIYVDLNGTRLYTDNNGKVSFTDLDTRVEYNYTISEKNYEEVKGSIFLESHNVIPINLQPKENKLVANEAGLNAKNGELTTDTQELSMAEILVYPNPAKDVITVETDGKERYAIELLSQSGSVVYQSTIEGNKHRINLSNLSNGVYFVTVKSDNFNRTQRIMKL